MSKTVLCVLLKVLMLAGADTLSKYPKNSVASRECDPMCPDSDLMQDIPVSENDDYYILQNRKSDRSHPDSVSVRNKVDKIPFANISVIPKSVESILSKPTSPRAFVEFHNGLLNKKDDIYVTFRWNQPKFTDEVIQGYTVLCWFFANGKEIQICDNKNISATVLECTVHNLKPNTTYYFQVRAYTKVGAGPHTDLIDVSTTHENTIPQLLIGTRNGIEIWDLDSKINVILVKNENVVYATYSIAEHKIYWSNIKSELMMLDMNKNSITKIANLQTFAIYLCIDWVARNLYWIEIDGYESYSIIKLDLTMWENGIVKYDKILKVKTKLYNNIFLNIQPSIGTLYWRINIKDYENQIMQSDLDGKNARIFQKNISICPFNMSRFSSMEIEDINTNKPLIYWLFDDYLFVTDINVSMCNLILRSEESVFRSLSIDKTNIYILLISDGIYVLKKKYALLESVDAFKYIQKIRAPFSINMFHAFGKSLQPYPPTRCLTPDQKVYNEFMYTVTTNSIIVNLPEPVPKSGCKKHNLPTTLYTIYINYCLDNELNKFDNFTVQTYERYYEIQNLTSLTEYKLLLVISNFYSDQLSMDSLFRSEVMLRTKPSKLGSPEDVTVYALTPIIAIVYWMPPKKLNCVPVIYEVHWTSIISSKQQIKQLFINKTEHKENSKFFTKIEPLIPGNRYDVYVRMYPVNFSNYYSESLSKVLDMYSEPNNIILNGVSINDMNVSWIPSLSFIDFQLEYKNAEMEEWQIVDDFEQNNRGKLMYYIKNLLPGTRYEFRLILKYPRYEKNFTWPSDGRFTFTTLTSDISNSPGVYSVVTQYYQYIISSLVAMVIVIFICYYLYRRRNKNNKQVLSSIMTDTELASLQEMPDGLLVHFNMSYNPILQYDSDEYVLIRITREQIKLEKLLGSGAFGMVYQGKVKNLGRTGIEIPAAVKMLRKNASSQERKMFLEEARLMKYFRHKHVLRLLAICLDPEIPSIVLELMETGDLLQYLRDSRKLQPSDSQALRLQDLFAICEDVARGCRYLEELRFVHRDLACRNCLVSARDRENRIVKIGDFGLSRDIYNRDYYKKGQELLPIRWMAPESLVVGKFTSQSDVWSFGIIMWEITSFGEHPYTGRTNLEVIDYVRTGGRLSMPLNCPPTLYELMLRCWSSANDRPNFKLCLKNIIALKNNIEDTLLSIANII